MKVVTHDQAFDRLLGGREVLLFPLQGVQRMQETGHLQVDYIGLGFFG
jgi:hypothetical protein